MNRKDVKSIKLITGEELIGVIQDANDSSVTIQGPFTVGRTMGSSFILVPWIVSMTESDVVDVNVNSVIAVADPDDQFFNAYVNVVNKIGQDDEDEYNTSPSAVFH